MLHRPVKSTLCPKSPRTLNIVFKHYFGIELTCFAIRGRPFDPEGGLTDLVGTDYLFSSRARPENLFPVKPRTEYLFSTATHFGKSNKKMGWGSVRGFIPAGHCFLCFA